MCFFRVGEFNSGRNCVPWKLLYLIIKLNHCFLHLLIRN